MSDSTRRTLRTVVAVLVAVAAMLPVLVAEAGLDPARWPWLAGILAVAAVITRLMASPVVDGLLTRLGIGKDATAGRHELGRGDDAGYGRSAVLLTVVAVAIVMLAVPASAGPRWWTPQTRTLVAPRVVSTAVCSGTLVVRHDAIQLPSGTQWQWRQDDGRAVLELQETSGRSGPDGAWGPVPWSYGPTVSGGERALRWPGWGTAAGHGLHYAAVRVVIGGYTSMPQPISTVCAA